MSERRGKNKMSSGGKGKRKRNTSTDGRQSHIDKLLTRRTKRSKIDSSKSSSQEGPEPDSPRAGAQRDQSLDSVQSRGAQKWDDYFMAVAFLSKLRSKDPNKQVGACIVNKNRQIIAIGYNGLPIGCSDDDFPWGKEGEQKKYPYVCHAEMNAIVNRTSTSYNLKGCTLYTTLSPCVECAKLIIRSGIKEVVWAEKFIREAPETKKLVDRTKVYAPNFECSKYQSLLEQIIEIDLKKIGRSPSTVAGEEEVGVTSVGEEEEASPGKGTQSAEEKGTQPDKGKKRPAELVIKWEDYHMALAWLLSWPFHDEDPDTTMADHDRMGACIVNEERRIVGTGSGSLPNPFGNDPWAVLVQGTDSTGRKHVMNAILNRTIATLKGCTVYSTVFPCKECAKLIIQSGIQKVVFAENKDMELKENKNAKRLLYHAGVCFKQYCAWPSVYKMKTKIVMDLKKAADSRAACRMVESD